jgi:hypothetical protein
MKKLSVIGAVMGAALMCAAPFSLHGSPAKSVSLSVTLDKAEAADLEIARPRHRSAYRHGYYYRAEYDPYCGGPYVGDGFNGGTYYGGPWIELACYVVPH